MSADQTRSDLTERTSTVDGMNRYCDEAFGPGAWAYDPDEDVWIIPVGGFEGLGRMFAFLERGGIYWTEIVPEEALI